MPHRPGSLTRSNGAITAWNMRYPPGSCRPFRLPAAGRPFPVRHIYCVGRNYAEHAKEMGGDATKEPPFFFTKPADAIVPVVPPSIGRIAYPIATRNYHHELELVVAIGKSGVKVAPERAQSMIFGYAVGLDMTRRDLQNDMREKKRPVGHRQVVRAIRTDCADSPGRHDRPADTRRDRAGSERRAPPARRSRRPGMGRAARPRIPVAVVSTRAGRSDLHRNAGRRRSRSSSVDRLVGRIDGLTPLAIEIVASAD